MKLLGDVNVCQWQSYLKVEILSVNSVKSLNITRHERLEIHHPLKSQLQWDRYIQSSVHSFSPHWLTPGGIC